MIRDSAVAMDEASPAPEQPEASVATESAPSVPEGAEAVPPPAEAAVQGAEPELPAELADTASAAEAGTSAPSSDEGDSEHAPAPAGAKRKRRRKPKKEGPQGPLARFVGQGGRRHAFAVGEVVAGRVVRAEAGVIVIDLFGKALAFADEHEPREAPPPPELPVGATASATVAAAGAVASGATADAAASAPERASEEVGAPQAPSGDRASLVAPVAALDDAGIAREDSDPAVDATSGSATDEAGAVLGDELAEAADANEDDASDDDEDDEAPGAAAPSGERTARTVRPVLAPLPIVSEASPRLNAPALGHIFRGRVGAVAESGHLVIVNRLVDAVAARADLEQCRETRRRVQGLVFGFNRGGFDVLVAGVRAFCPVRAMALDVIEDPDTYVGQRLEFLIPTFQPLGRDIIVSRRSILEREQRKRAREFVRTLAPGQRLRGRVTQVFEFGLLVDIGGAEGLVHQSELSWARGVRPADVAVPGDEVEVQVLRVGEPGGKPGGGRKDRIARVGLSIRALQPDPWATLAATLVEGSVRKGKVVRATEFGAFVELVPSIEGLLHVSELGRDVKHAGDVLKEGEEIHVVVEHVDDRARRISLSKPTASEIQDQEAGRLGGPDAPKNVRPGARVKVRVEKLEHRGLLVRIVGLAGRRARGFLAKSDLAGGRDGDHRRAFPVGSEVDVKVVGLDRDGEMKFSVKALEIDDERRAVKDYRREAATKGFGTFGDLLRAKLGETGK